MFKIPRTTIQKYLPYILIGMLLITAIVVWQGFFKKEKPILPEIIFIPQKIEIDFECLEDPILRELQPFEKIKPFEEGTEIGRKNPFLPYQNQ